MVKPSGTPRDSFKSLFSIRSVNPFRVFQFERFSAYYTLCKQVKGELSKYTHTQISATGSNMEGWF